MAPTKFEMSKTYQYRKVMKPLLERKRRARINKCLDDLKDLIAECMQQQSGDPNVKLEKADILELTVQHLRNIKSVKLQQCYSISGQQSFRSGYIQAANEVSRCLATLPKVDVTLGTKLMTHLGLRLNQLESSADEVPIASSTPLSIACSTTTQSSSYAATCSPVSSGYASDSECATSQYTISPAMSGYGLLQVAATMWRPW